MNKIYAGIGSRETPMQVMETMDTMGAMFASLGYVLRSGGAKGADTAFETGCDNVKGAKKIFDAERRDLWRIHASKYHPNWEACTEYAKDLHARNSAIVLGENLDKPVDFIMCWTDGGHIKGGTGQALRIAPDWKIPVFNLFHDVDADGIWDWMQKHGI